MRARDLYPGRELDELVAEKVMGWRKRDIYWENDETQKQYCGVGYKHSRGDIDVPDFCPSADIEAAFLVMVKFGFTLAPYGRGEAITRWHAANGEHFAYGLTAPMAICIAALRAVGVLDKPDNDDE